MNETKAARYQRLRRRARTAEAACAGGALALVALTPLGRRLSDIAVDAVRGMSGSAGQAAALVVFVLVVVLIVDAATLPASLYVALRLDRRYRSDAERSPEDVLGAHVHALAVVMPASIIAAGLVVVSRAVAGWWWWAIAGPMLAGALVSALRVAPALLGQLAGVRPIDRRELVHRLQTIAERANVRVAGIVEWQVAGDTRATALVTGAGRGRRILVASELLRNWSDDEIAVVVAHELGHVARGDLWRTLLLDVAVLWIALFAAHLSAEMLAGSATGIGAQLAALPVVALVSLGVWAIATPLRHGYSRAQERCADRFALETTGGIDAFAAALRRLGARHLAEERPSLTTRWLYHRHPPVSERLQAAEAFRQAQQGGPDVEVSIPSAGR